MLFKHRPPAAECDKATKFLTQYERLAAKYGSRLRPRRIATLDALRNAGTIKPSHLPGVLQREFPGTFDDMTLAEIRRECGGS